jgi:hypothetical protein
MLHKTDENVGKKSFAKMHLVNYLSKISGQFGGACRAIPGRPEWTRPAGSIDGKDHRHNE